MIFDEKLREDTLGDLGWQIIRWLCRTSIAGACFASASCGRLPARHDSTPTPHRLLGLCIICRCCGVEPIDAEWVSVSLTRSSISSLDQACGNSPIACFSKMGNGPDAT